MLAGKLGDLFGRKRVFQVSMVIFIIGSALFLASAFDHAISAGYLAGPYENLTLTKAGADESGKFVRELKAWVAERLTPVGGDNPAALDHALEHLARTALTDEEPVLTHSTG